MDYTYIDNENSSPSASPSDNTNYNELRDLVTSPNNKDVYTEIMNKENYVLGTINKIADNENKKNNTYKKIYNLTLREILVNLLKVIVDIINEMSIILIDPVNKNGTIMTTIMKLRKTLTKTDRLIYVGLFFIIISILIYFIDITV
jgi:hypothetical protein